jgi:hypothetical protein
VRTKAHVTAAETANRLFVFCHGWVSLDSIGFFTGAGDAQTAFDRAVLALLASV